MPEAADIPVFVLCGGLGTRLGDMTAARPKPMIEIGDRPMLTHVMGCYGRHGFRKFILCAGYRSEVISNYFLNFAGLHSDFTIDLRDRSVSYHQTGFVPDWEVTVAHTGASTMTGARIALAGARYLGHSEHFAVTYGDGLTDADLGEEVAFHLGHDRLGTVLGINQPSQYGRLDLHEDHVAGFAEKPTRPGDWINGGFFLFRRGFLDYLSTDESCVLENAPLGRLAADRQLKVFRWGGYWSCVDTVPDHQRAAGLWEAGTAPWRY
jgi:glucose-1-phosphate cytidylyltransferase